LNLTADLGARSRGARSEDASDASVWLSIRLQY
jgi:hypothetical protein